MGSNFCENYKILKEKEAELDNFVHQPPLGGANKVQVELICINKDISLTIK